MLTENELKWVRNVLEDYVPSEMSPSYLYRRKTEFNRSRNKEKTRKELDELRRKMLNATPVELVELKDKTVRENRGIKNFTGIYIIQNCIKNIYYVGQSERVFDRAYKHFITSPKERKGRYELSVEFNLPEIYMDYNSGDEFSVSLIPLENTSFSSLNELEGTAILAYNSLAPDGYNRVNGIIMDKPIFKNDDYEKVAELLFDRIKETKGEDLLLSLTNSRKRRAFTNTLFSELQLPRNVNFIIEFWNMIKEYKKAYQKVKK